MWNTQRTTLTLGYCVLFICAGRQILRIRLPANSPANSPCGTITVGPCSISMVGDPGHPRSIIDSHPPTSLHPDPNNTRDVVSEEDLLARS